MQNLSRSSRPFPPSHSSRSTRPFSVFILCTLLAAAALVGSAWLLSRFFLRIQSTTEHTVTVKGVAEKQVISDVGSFTCIITCTAKTLPEGYQTLEKHTAILNKKLAELGFTAADFDNVRVDSGKVNETVRIKENNREVTREEFRHYTFSRSCRIRSTNVKAVEKASAQLYELAAKGISIQVCGPEFCISSPEQYKLELIDSATRSAYERAGKIARTGGGKLGRILTARQGVIQITRPDGISSDDYGSYDTTSIPKTMRLVVTLTFALD